MGLEAYRIKIEPTRMIDREQLFSYWNDMGYQPVGESCTDQYLEKICEWGIIEIALRNELRKLMEHERHRREAGKSVADLLRPDRPYEDRESVQIQIAKPNHENTVDILLEDLRTLDRLIPIRAVNMQTKKAISLDDNGELKEHFKRCHDEYLHWFSAPHYPIRCGEESRR